MTQLNRSLRASWRIASLCVALASPQFIGAQPVAQPDTATQRIINDRVAAKGAFGIVVAEIEKGRAPQILTAGASGVEGLKLDGNTLFEIGSVTKVFTAALLADMVSRGEVKLEDPVAKYLPSSVSVPSRNGKQITLFDLSTQSSGLPRLPTNLRPADMRNPYADYTVRNLYDFLLAYQLPRDPGATFEYSNLGVGLLGHALSLKAGRGYEAILTERILRPLGMTDTRITLDSAMRRRLARGHDASGAPVDNWDLPTLAGAGALRSTALDLAKFVTANLDSTIGPLAKTLAVTRVRRRPTDNPNASIALNWIMTSPFGTPIIWHNGGTGGYHSFIGINQSTGRGVVILSNSSTSIDDIGFHILEPRAPLSVPTAPRTRKEITIDPTTLDAFVGVYELAPTFRITITKENGALFAQATDQPKFQLYAESPTDFFLKVVDAQITFVRDPDGKVNQLVLHQNGANLPGRRVN